MDREDDGVYLEPGSYWTFGLPTPVDQLPHRGKEPDPEEDHSAVLAPPSHNISSAPSADRVETQPNLCDPLSSFAPTWQSPHVQELDPSSPLVSNRVYTVPSLPGGLLNVPKIDKKVLAKAEKLSLHPKQEHMRFNIAKALLAHKPRSPRSKAKSSLFNVLKRL